MDNAGVKNAMMSSTDADISLEKILSNIYFELERIKDGTKPVMTFKEAVTYTGYSYETMRNLVRSNQIAYCKPVDGGSGKIFFKREDLLDYMTQNRTPSKSELDRKAADYILNH